MKYKNISVLFKEQVRKLRDRPAFYARKGNIWESTSWIEWGEKADELASALIACGLKPASSVCILMGNVPEWPIADLGVIMAGGVSVGLYPTSSAQQCSYIINHSDAEFVLVDTAAQLEKLLQIRSDLPKVKTIIVAQGAYKTQQGIWPLSEFLKLGRERFQQTYSTLRNQAEGAHPDDIAIIVYTSGTTGNPKGACLSHRYLLESVKSLNQVIPLNADDIALSYLPYCHVAERIAGLYNRIYAGVTAYLVDDMARFWDYVREVKPSVFASVPRFYEKAYAQIMADLGAATDQEKERFWQAIELGRRAAPYRRIGSRIPAELEAQLKEHEQVFEKVRAYFGGRVRVATSGGAPLSQDIEEFFEAAGLIILQAYGLTENLCVAFNRPNRYKPGTVGLPMPGCQVRRAEDGEILVRSRMMFSGYYKEPDETAETVIDGWLHTGDLGQLDQDGFLKITGRKKEIIVTSTGKNISPALIENMLKEDPLISQALVYGDRRSYLVALITINKVEAANRGVQIPDAEPARNPHLVSLVQKVVDRVNSRLSSTEQIKRFALLDKDFSIEADEITPTMKIKRDVLSKRYASLIEDLYKQDHK
jgi:long-chain acyl-CoA synthetase